jgi:hypothetical protein
MACAGFLLASVLAAVTPSLPDAVHSSTEPSAPSSVASPRISVGKPIDLSVAGAIHNPAMPSSGAGLVPPSIASSWDDSEARPGISLGPLHTQFGGTTGRRMHLATVKLEGVSIFGGSVGGSVDSRSARITLSWPTSR